MCQHRCAAAAYSQLLQVNWSLQSSSEVFFQRDEGLRIAEHLSVFEWAQELRILCRTVSTHHTSVS